VVACEDIQGGKNAQFPVFLKCFQDVLFQSILECIIFGVMKVKKIALTMPPSEN